MRERTNLRPLALAALLAALLLPLVSSAQEDINSFKVGERVEYKDSSYPESWKEGTVVKVQPEYKQVVVRWDPRADYPSYTHDGVSTYEQAYSISDVRHIKARTAERAAPTGGGNIDAPAGGNDGETNNRPEKAPVAAAAGTGTGLMTKQEILGYMRTHGYSNGQPKKDPQVCKDLIEQIKRRGVRERLEVGKDDLSPIYANGCATFDTDVAQATSYNIGPPTTLDWLKGTWNMTVTGGTVDTAPGDGYIYRRNESFAKLGFLTINANGTYTWKVDPSDPPSKYVHGTWRKATPEEMKLQGGAGVVLQKAAEGRDWIAYKYMDPFSKADRIDVQDLQYRGSYRRIGWRR